MADTIKMKSKKSQQLKETIESAVNDLVNNQEKTAAILPKFSTKSPEQPAENKPELNLDLARQAVLEEIQSALDKNKEKAIGRKKIKAKKPVPASALLPVTPSAKKEKETAKAIFPQKPLSANATSLLPKESVAIKKDLVAKPVVKSRSKFSYLKVFLTTFLSLIFFCFFIFTLGLYLGRWQGPAMILFSRSMPFPAGYVNGEAIKVYTFLSDLAVLQNYLKRQNQPIEIQAMRRQVLERLIQLKVAAQLAESAGIKVAEQDINERVAGIGGNPDLIVEAQKLTKELYGWDFPTYIEKVIKPLVLTSKLQENFNQSAGGGYIKERMEGFVALLAKDATKFSEIAAEVNEDDSRSVKGDLGWLKLNETAPEFELPLLKLQPGEISPIVETRYGYHIIRLEEKMADGIGQPIFHVSHIFLKRPFFEDYLNEQIKKATVVTLIRI